MSTTPAPEHAGAVEEHRPVLEVGGGWRFLSFGTFNDEVGEDLRLDCLPRHVGDVVAHDLHFPCSDLSDHVLAVDDFNEGEGCHQPDMVTVQVVVQLASGDENSVHEFLHLSVTGLGVGEHLTDEVHGSLNLQGSTFL